MKTGASNWVTFFICLACVYLFVFVVAPALQDTSLIKPMAEIIGNMGIDVSV